MRQHLPVGAALFVGLTLGYFTSTLIHDSPDALFNGDTHAFKKEISQSVASIFETASQIEIEYWPEGLTRPGVLYSTGSERDALALYRSLGEISSVKFNAYQYQPIVPETVIVHVSFPGETSRSLTFNIFITNKVELYFRSITGSISVEFIDGRILDEIRKLKKTEELQGAGLGLDE